MTAEPPGSPVTEGVRSLEVRWILYWVSAGNPARSFFATPMQSGHVVSLCG